VAKRLDRVFQRRLRDEFLNSNRFNSLLEAQVLIEDWRIDYNMNRPQCARLAQPQRVRPSMDNRHQPQLT
jgi:hypothetical protein